MCLDQLHHSCATAPVDNLNTASPKIRAGTASGEVAYSSDSSQLALPQLPSYFPKSGHVMPDFKHSLMDLGSICDNECSVHFHKYTVTIYDPQGIPFLQGRRDNTSAKLWCFYLRPQSSTPSSTEEDKQAFTIITKSRVKSSDLQSFSAYDLTSVEALVRFFPCCCGVPIQVNLAAFLLLQGLS